METEVISHYRIGRRIGGGGMGVVYEAEDVRLGRRAALKFLPESMEHDSAALERLQREARAASSLNHPNICTIYEVNEHNGRHFIAMELLEGRSLSTVVANGMMPIAEVLDFAVQIADALDSAHTKGVVHRDLKPANLYLTNRGQAKILDFGLAKVQNSFSAAHPSINVTAEHLTSPGTTIGTVAYMSPEQARGEGLDGRSDLFSLGAVVYEMLTGHLPFKGTTSAVIFNQILEHAPLPPSRLNPEVSPQLESVVLKLLEKDRDLRYQSAAELRADLKRLKRDSESGKTAAVPVRAQRTQARTRTIVWVGAVVVVAAIVGVLLFWRPWAQGGVAVPQSEWTALTDFSGAASQPALSPDGHMLAFIRAEGPFLAQGDLFVKLLPNGTPVQLTHDNTRKMTPTFSPDGSEIAYTVLEDNAGWNTYVVPVLGGEPRLFLPNAAGLIWIDEHQFLFSEIDRGIHMKLVTAGEGRANEREVYVPSTDYGMAHLSALSPDKHWVLLLEMDERGMLPCRLVPFDGKDAGRAVGPDGVCERVAWTPDGRWMLMTATTKSGTHLWRQRFPNGKPEQLTFGTTDQAGIAVTADGTAIITADGKSRNVALLHDEKGERQITSEGSPSDLRYASDGRTIYYLDSARTPQANEQAGELRAFDVATGATQSVFAGIPITSYALTADGKRVVYSSFTGDEPHTWVAPLDHSSPPREINKEWSVVTFVAPDNTVYYVKKSAPKMYTWKMNIDGAHPMQVSTEPEVVGALSPDQQWSLIWSTEREEQHDTLYLERNDDKKAIKICTWVCTARWPSPDRFIVRTLGIGMTDSKTYVFKVTPTKPVPDGMKDMEKMADLDRFARAVGARILPTGNDVTMHPTTDAYAYTRREGQRNLYRIPLPK